MTFAEFQRAVSEDRIPPVVLFHGEEPYLARLGVEQLKERVLTAGSEPFDFASLSGRDATAEAIAAQAATAPMLSDRRLTVVYELERLPASQRGKLAQYIANPVESSCLALVSYDRLAGKNKFEGQLLSSAAVVECGRAIGKVLRDLARRMAEAKGAQIDDDALSVLLETTEGGLNRIANELEKLATFVGAGETITVSDVEQVAGTSASTLADLVAAIGEREPGRALEVLNDLRDEGREDASLVTKLFGYWMALWLRRVPGGSGGRRRGPYELPPALGKTAARLAAARTSREYAAGVRLFLDADRDIRRGVPAGPTVGMLVYRLAAGR